MMLQPLLRLLPFLPASAMLLSSCALKPVPTTAAVQPPPKLYEWTDEEVSGRTSVRIALDEQKAHIYRGGTEVAWTTLASGVANHPTPVGHFYVMEKIEDKRSNLYGVIANGE